MSTEKPAVVKASFEERKKALIAEGARMRSQVDASIKVVRTNLHADRLAKTAVSHLAAAAYSAADRVFGIGRLRSGIASANVGDYFSGRGMGKLMIGAKRFLPLATTAYSIIKRRKLVGPVLKGAAVAAALSGGYVVWKSRRHQHAVQADMHGYPAYTDPGI